MSCVPIPVADFDRPLTLPRPCIRLVPPPLAQARSPRAATLLVLPPPEKWARGLAVPEEEDAERWDGLA